MKNKTILALEKAKRGEILNSDELVTLMQYSIELLKHFNKLTQESIDVMIKESKKLITL